MFESIKCLCCGETTTPGRLTCGPCFHLLTFEERRDLQKGMFLVAETVVNEAPDRFEAAAGTLQVVVDRIVARVQPIRAAKQQERRERRDPLHG